MKIKAAVFATLILLAVSSPILARKSSARALFLDSPLKLNGAEIPEGMYQLALESSNSHVRVTLRKDGQFVATAAGVWVKGGVKYAENTLLLRVNSDGSRSLIEIRLAGSAKTIVLNDSDTIIRFSPK
jgi:hypothetical protein